MNTLITRSAANTYHKDAREILCESVKMGISRNLCDFYSCVFMYASCIIMYCTIKTYVVQIYATST